MTIFTPTEAAEKLKLKPTTVIRLFDAGILPGIIIRQGVRKRIIRFSETALEKMLTAREKHGNRAEVGRDGRTNR